MKLFVNDTPLHIIGPDTTPDPTHYELTIDALQTSLTDAKLKDDVLVINANEAYLKSCLDSLGRKRVKKLDSITFLVQDVDATVSFIKRQFKIIKAAGGLVVKDQKVLMIYRMDRWDLPKGKLEGKEKVEAGAVREVAEECGVQVKIRDKIGVTWHTYTQRKRKILKKTHWFLMDCVDDSQMQPQHDEDITEVRWMSHEEAQHALYNSYFSIRYIFRKYLKDRGEG